MSGHPPCSTHPRPADWMYSIVITALIYPVVVHWGWSSDGFLTQASV